MSFGETLTVGGLVFNRIEFNQSGSTYLLRNSDRELKFFINHSIEKKPDALGNPIERHYVKYTRTAYATDTAPLMTRETSFSIRNHANDSVGAQSSAAFLLAFLTGTTTSQSTEETDAYSGINGLLNFDR